MSYKILCGGPVSEDKDTYDLHIKSLLSQGYNMDYKGIDNSPSLLEKPFGFNSVEFRREESLGEYKQNKIRFNSSLLRKMGEWREEMRVAAISGNYDYLFMVDSDLILSHDTLKLLIDSDKDYIAGLIWTEYRPGSTYNWPNCWHVCDNKNSEHTGHIRRIPNKLYRSNYNKEFIGKLKNGGIHEVGLTGACCLISKRILNLINYSPYKNSVGDDEWLSISARLSKIPLYINCNVEIHHRRRR